MEIKEYVPRFAHFVVNESLNVGNVKLFDKDTAEEVKEEMKRVVGSRVPWSNIYISNLGGEYTIIGKLVFKEQEKWTNGILQNENWMNFFLEEDGELHFDSSLYKYDSNGNKTYSRENRLTVRLAKKKVKSIEQAEDLIIKYIDLVKENLWSPIFP